MISLIEIACNNKNLELARTLGSKLQVHSSHWEILLFERFLSFDHVHSGQSLLAST